MAIFDFNGNNITDGTGEGSSELQRKFSGRNIVWLGDSIHNYEQGGINIPYLFELDSNAKCYNWAQGGVCMAKTGVENYDPFCGAGMVEALISKNFTEQDKWKEDRNFVKQVAEMKSLNLKTVYACIIEYGTNDGWKEVPVGNPDEGFDVNTTCGALRYMIQQLLTNYPSMKLAVCTTQPGSGFLDAEQRKPFDLKTQSDAIRNVCRNLSIPCIDIYNDLGWNEWTKGYLSSDGTHRSYSGKIRQKDVIANRMCLFY